MIILSIDQGTTNTKVALVDLQGTIIDAVSKHIPSQYPEPGWVEQSALEIWRTTEQAIVELTQNNAGKTVDGIAISNQRETTVCWDADTSIPVCPAITWQCTRGKAISAQLASAGHSNTVQKHTGLELSPFYPASKAAWIMQNIDEAGRLAALKRLRFGTVDTWLLWQLTGGSSFATDYTNASRTQLFDTVEMGWSSELCHMFGVPEEALASPMNSQSLFGITSSLSTGLPSAVPILAMLGDSHASLYGHRISTSGSAKATFGTGTSVMAVSKSRALSKHGLSSTIAWSDQKNVHYALEGNINISGQAAQFTSSILGLAGPKQLTQLAKTVETSNGAVFVPALSGLGAPHWKSDAKGFFSGLTHGTKPAHLARATFEAIALQVYDIISAMEQDMGHEVSAVHVDGGASANSYLMQLQADILNKPILKPAANEIGLVGVATLAMGALTDVNLNRESDCQKFIPNMSADKRRSILNGWHDAIVSLAG